MTATCLLCRVIQFLVERSSSPALWHAYFFFWGGGGFATLYMDTKTLAEIFFLQTSRTQTIKETICEEEEEEEEEEEKEEEGERKKSATEGEILLASFTD